MARRISNDLSAPDFVDAVIQALGEKCGFTPDVGVEARFIVPRVLELMDISDVGDHGYMDEVNKKRPYVERWIGGAFRSVRAEDKADPALGYTVSRGLWALTEEGADRASALHLSHSQEVVESPVVESPVVEAPVVETVKVTPEVLSTPLPRKNLGKGVSLGPLTPVEEYHQDPYIVGLGGEQTACFGFWSTRSDICSRCSLQAPCLGSLQGKIAALGAKFNQDLASFFAGKAEEDDVTETVARAFAEPDKAPAMTRDPKWAEQDLNASPVCAAGEAVCFRCKQKITTGTHALWLSGIGMWHKDC